MFIVCLKDCGLESKLSGLLGLGLRVSRLGLIRLSVSLWGFLLEGLVVWV